MRSRAWSRRSPQSWRPVANSLLFVSGPFAGVSIGGDAAVFLPFVNAEPVAWRVPIVALIVEAVAGLIFVLALHEHERYGAPGWNLVAAASGTLKFVLLALSMIILLAAYSNLAADYVRGREAPNQVRAAYLAVVAVDLGPAISVLGGVWLFVTGLAITFRSTLPVALGVLGLVAAVISVVASIVGGIWFAAAVALTFTFVISVSARLWRDAARATPRAA